MQKKYNMSDMGKFVADYNSRLFVRPKSWMMFIPFVGRKMYQKASLEEHKRERFERELYLAANELIDQKKYIEEMTPVLELFYSNKKRKRR